MNNEKGLIPISSLYTYITIKHNMQTLIFNKEKAYLVLILRDVSTLFM